jgi:hypothetical protein
MLDLFQPPVINPATGRVVKLLTDEPRAKPGRKFVGPKKPRKAYVRSPEQNRAKYERYLAAHGRDHINALRSEARRAERA